MNPTQKFNNNVDNIVITPMNSTDSVTFKAFLTNFSDTYKNNWSSQDIFGRMDPIYTYKNTVRTIAIGFDVPSYDLAEGKQNMIKAEKMIRNMYPTYDIAPGASAAAIISSPPYFMIKFANLISSSGTGNSNLLGWIDNFVFKPEIESGFFVENQILIAKLYKVSFNFNVVHMTPLGYQLKEGKRVSRHDVAGSKSFPYDMETIPGGK